MNAVASKAPRLDYRNVFTVIAWFAKTALMAVLSPYALVALIMAMVSVLGVSANDVRQNFVALATLDANSWASTSAVWHSFSLLCYAVVIFYRVHTSKPVQSFYSKLETSIDAWTKPVFTWLDTNITLKPIHRKVIATLMVLAVAGGTALLASQPSRTPMDLNGKPLPAFKPSSGIAAAAITFADGSITSGKATVAKQADGKYVVSFTN